MNLCEYLNLYDIRPAEFGRRIGTKSRTTVMRYLTGERIPSKAIQERIYRETNGLVTPADFEESKNGQKVKIPQAANDDLLHEWGMNCKYSERNVNKAFNRMMTDPQEWDNLTPPLSKALETLFPRAVFDRKSKEFYLDGRRTRPVDIVKKANRILKTQRKPTIAYPNV